MTQESCSASVTSISGCSSARSFPLPLKYEGRKPLVQRSIGKDLDTDSALIAISSLYVPLARGIQPIRRVTSKKGWIRKIRSGCHKSEGPRAEAERKTRNRIKVIWRLESGKSRIRDSAKKVGPSRELNPGPPPNKRPFRQP